MALGFLREARGLALAADAIETGSVGLHARPEHAAEEPRYRLAARLASNVPAGDVERADRADERAFLAVVARVVVHAVPEHLGLERVGADDEWRERVPYGGRGDLRRLQPLAERLAPADDAFVGRHLDQRRAAALHPALGEGERLLERRAKHMDADAGNLHRPIIGMPRTRTRTAPLYSVMPIRTEIHEGRVPVKIYTTELEAAARQQLVNISKLPIVHHHVAAMPDVHLGIGATVGSVIPTKQAIIPAAVGVDIGCGMI